MIGVPSAAALWALFALVVFVALVVGGLLVAMALFRGRSADRGHPGKSAERSHALLPEDYRDKDGR